jgi:RNA polymerase sigma-70 factor (ECF subfamily)
VELPTDAARRAFVRGDASRWGVSADTFDAALRRSVFSRFRGLQPSSAEVSEYLDALHASDLALACACARGDAGAWEHFVSEFRPILLRVAGRNAPHDAARDVADSIYAELYGLEERDGVRRSLFDYYHGRSPLGSWLRAVVAQRLVDRARAARRFDPLPEPGESGEPVSAGDVPDPDQGRLLPVVQAALKGALAGLEPKDRLRLSLYYTQEMKLAAIGRVLGESEATASRKLERTRRELRAAVERRLRDEHGMSEREVRESFDYARTDPAFDLARTLPPG